MSSYESRLTRREAELLVEHGSSVFHQAVGRVFLRKAEEGEIEFAEEGVLDA